MQAHQAAEFADQARSMWQDASHLHLYNPRRRGGKVMFIGAPISQTQQLVAGIEPGPHNPETSTEPLRSSKYFSCLTAHVSNSVIFKDVSVFYVEKEIGIIILRECIDESRFFYFLSISEECES